MTAPAPLVLQGVHKAFDRSEILRGVDLQLQPGERCAGRKTPCPMTSREQCGRKNRQRPHGRADVAHRLIHEKDEQRTGPKQCSTRHSPEPREPELTAESDHQ